MPIWSAQLRGVHSGPPSKGEYFEKGVLPASVALLVSILGFSIRMEINFKRPVSPVWIDPGILQQQGNHLCVTLLTGTEERVVLNSLGLLGSTLLSLSSSLTISTFPSWQAILTDSQHPGSPGLRQFPVAQ